VLHVVCYYDYNEIGESDCQAESDTDRGLPSLGGDRKWDPDKHKCENRHRVREPLANFGLVRGVIRNVLALFKRVPQLVQSEFVRTLTNPRFAKKSVTRLRAW
jgi:hypothetical protein